MERKRYVAFVEDSIFEDGIFEYRSEAPGEEEALLNAQEAFPSGVIRSVHLATEVVGIDEQIRSAEKKRKAATDELIALLARAKTLE